MKINFNLILICFLAIAMFQCKSNDPQHIEQEKVHDELMVVHDEVMPKMGQIHKLRKKLVKAIKNNAELAPETKTKIEQTVKFLENADDGMMDWMSGYKRPSKLRGDKSHEEILAYLESERPKVGKVKSDILNSISQAEALITSLGID